ncbi:MAG: helix-turn-helix transcriptional regulator [Ruminococcaceae bacterium]|nr:helix-turn-helix transcriptional regulator [Oscillospiraceae bacterium]
MAISYNKLWKLLIDKNMTKTQLRKRAGLTTNVIAKMGKNQSVQVESLYKICDVLGCGLDDISEVIPEQDNLTEESK